MARTVVTVTAWEAAPLKVPPEADERASQHRQKRPSPSAMRPEVCLECPYHRSAWAKPDHMSAGGSACEKKPRTEAERIPLGSCDYLRQADRW